MKILFVMHWQFFEQNIRTWTLGVSYRNFVLIISVFVWKTASCRWSSWRRQDYCSALEKWNKTVCHQEVSRNASIFLPEMVRSMFQDESAKDDYVQTPVTLFGLTILRSMEFGVSVGLSTLSVLFVHCKLN